VCVQPFAFEAREYLRVLLVGKEVKFTITNTIQTANGALEFGVVLAGGEIDVGLAVVKAGFAKVRDGAGKDAEEGGRTSQLREAQDEAQAAGKGVWGVSKQATVDYSMPEDPVAFLAEHKGVPVDGELAASTPEESLLTRTPPAIIEAVSNGSSIRARLLLSPTHHQIVNLGIAGVRAPRSGNAGGDSSQGEEFGDEVSLDRRPARPYPELTCHVGPLLCRVATAPTPDQNHAPVPSHADCRPLLVQLHRCPFLPSLHVPRHHRPSRW
jgi:staphylococcal nuclease domain-containing protein 1